MFSSTFFPNTVFDRLAGKLVTVGEATSDINRGEKQTNKQQN